MNPVKHIECILVHSKSPGRVSCHCYLISTTTLPSRWGYCPHCVAVEMEPSTVLMSQSYVTGETSALTGIAQWVGHLPAN